MCRFSNNSPLFRWSALYLTIQALGAAIWWAILFFAPNSRALFRLSDAPDATLLAFFVPDALFFIGAGLWAAGALWRAPQTATIPLSLHVGAASYAALYCLAQWLLSGQAPLAALLMAPALVVGPLLLWICSRA